MTTLKEFQQQFLANVLYEDNCSEPGFSIYHSNIFSNLTKALQNTYPLIEKLIGKECFNTAAVQYIQEYPSQQSDLHEFGKLFALFLTQYPPTQSLAYLPEVAVLEWAYHSLFFMADHPGLDLAALAKVTVEQHEHLQLYLHPASQLFAFNYPISQIIKLCHSEVADNISLESGGDYILVIRRQLEIQLVNLSKSDFTFLSVLQKSSLTDAMTAALHIDPLFSLETRLPQWVQEKTIVGFAIKTYSTDITTMEVCFAKDKA